MAKSVYEIITEKIIEKLEKGVVPWRKPWTNSNAVAFSHYCLLALERERGRRNERKKDFCKTFLL